MPHWALERSEPVATPPADDPSMRKFTEMGVELARAVDTVRLTGTPFTTSNPTYYIEEHLGGQVYLIPVGGSQGMIVSYSLYGAEPLVAMGNVSGSVNVDLTQASAFTMTLVGNTVLTFVGAPTGKVAYATIRVTQDATGGHTLDVTGRQGSFGANALSNLSSAAGATDEVVCASWDGGSHWTVGFSEQSIA